MSILTGNPAMDFAIKEAQRQAIRIEIRMLQKEIREAQNLKTKLSRENSRTGNSVTNWQNGLKGFESCSMAAVTVTDKFEGESAEIISSRLPDPIMEMNNTKMAAERVQGAANAQLNKLDSYIAKKENEIASLEAKLAAI